MDSGHGDTIASSPLWSVATTLGFRLAGLWLAYHIARALYNISPLHPLSHIPGPKLAAMTIWYEIWFELVKFGRYSSEIKKMHESYGPIVRISPDEVHTNDPSMVDEIYAAGGRRREKSALWTGSLTGPVAHSILTTVDHDLHRRRRQAMANSFSRSSIAKLEPVLHSKVQQLCAKFLRYPKGKVFDVTSAYSCFTTDVISEYCFGEPFGLLDQDDWEPNFRAPTTAMQNAQPLFKYFHITHYLADVLPVLAKRMSAEMAFFIKSITEDMPGRVIRAKEAVESGVIRDRPFVFEEMLKSDALSESDKSVYRMTGDGMILMSAGTETTAWTLTVLTYHLLSNAELMSRLRAELESTDPERLAWTELEKLPYLTGVILEALRLSYGIAARLPRVAPDEDLVYRGGKKGRREYVIPRGTAIGMSTVVTHHNEDIFPNSHAFAPERWFDAEGRRKPELEKHMLSFSRGSRACVGLQLAWCNMYLATAALVLRVFPAMALFETTIDDVAYDHDAFVSRPKVGTKGVRVVMS
ncbi:cytochrome P450 [Xylariomycetidae sp. FL2044]|nr:cytochrome P450 [Xylariomycetidae sp. FL2044]